MMMEFWMQKMFSNDPNRADDADGDGITDQDPDDDNDGLLDQEEPSWEPIPKNPIPTVTESMT